MIICCPWQKFEYRNNKIAKKVVLNKLKRNENLHVQEKENNTHWCAIQLLTGTQLGEK